MEKIKETKEKILEEYKKIFKVRIEGTDQFWQNHGGEPWNEITLPEFLSQSLDHIASVARIEGREEGVECIYDYWKMLNNQGVSEKQLIINVNNYFNFLAKLTGKEEGKE